MSLAPKSNWQPSATIEHLRARAAILKNIRAFFAAHEVLEVETPLLCHTSVTDPHLASIPALFQLHPAADIKTYYLQTSPEYAMKRLLAQGAPAIYQLCKAFRQGEIGREHNPEFTMLEWYRLGFDHHQLMDEMDALLQSILQTDPATRVSYGDLFETHLSINPHTASIESLIQCAKTKKLSLSDHAHDQDTWLQLLMSHCIEPHIGLDRPCFVYDFPASQAALARIQPTHPPVASRFEVYFGGRELANGFHELSDAKEQRARFENHLQVRKQMGLPLLPIDEYFLAALHQGLPDCAGVALGVDRLIMLALKAKNINEVLSFDFERA